MDTILTEVSGLIDCEIPEINEAMAAGWHDFERRFHLGVELVDRYTRMRPVHRTLFETWYLVGWNAAVDASYIWVDEFISAHQPVAV